MTMPTYGMVLYKIFRAFFILELIQILWHSELNERFKILKANYGDFINAEE
jgi:hypothetical protein